LKAQPRLPVAKPVQSRHDFCVAMSFAGKVQNGVVVLPPGVHLADGECVEVIPLTPSPEEAFLLRETAQIPRTPGTLPDDLAANHHFYLHGARKQKPRRGRWLPAGEANREMSVEEAQSFTDQLQRFAAETRGLPPDLAAQHDHYLHGLPKK
jgi:hypothetical protein